MADQKRKRATKEDVNPLPGSTTPDMPDLDPATERDVTPLPSGPRNPSLDYDDDDKG